MTGVCEPFGLAEAGAETETVAPKLLSVILMKPHAVCLRDSGPDVVVGSGSPGV
jgi:hypothetical protein